MATSGCLPLSCGGGGDARPVDVFNSISASGNNLVAIEQARKQSITTVAFTGEGDRKLALCECLSIPSRCTTRILEYHIMIDHIVWGTTEQQYFTERD